MLSSRPDAGLAASLGDLDLACAAAGPPLDGDVHDGLEVLLTIARSANARGEQATVQRTLSNALQVHARVHNPSRWGD